MGLGRGHSSEPTYKMLPWSILKISFHNLFFRDYLRNSEFSCRSRRALSKKPWTARSVSIQPRTNRPICLSTMPVNHACVSTPSQLNSYKKAFRNNRKCLLRLEHGMLDHVTTTFIIQQGYDCLWSPALVVIVRIPCILASNAWLKWLSALMIAELQ